MIEDFFYDAFFAAIAAIGFSAISNPPRKAYLFCALIAAAGHSARFLLMNPQLAGVNIIPATAIAAFVTGTLAVILSPLAKIPAETFLFPSLLPMIPGIYAYKTFGALAMCLFKGGDESDFIHYLYLLAGNGLTCLFIVIGMVVGGMLPIFFLNRIAYRATR